MTIADIEPLTRDNWPIAAAMINFPSVLADGTTTQDQDAEGWAATLRAGCRRRIHRIRSDGFLAAGRRPQPIAAPGIPRCREECRLDDPGDLHGAAQRC